MEWLEWIIKVSAVVGIIFGVVRSLDGIKKDVKETKEYVMNNIKNVEDIPKIKEHCEANYITGLRLTIMNSEMPIGERISAGTEYIKLGGNGDVKKYLIEELHINDVYHN